MKYSNNFVLRRWYQTAIGFDISNTKPGSSSNLENAGVYCANAYMPFGYKQR